ncbi:MAG TPA: MarR family winged helix-turn-helix transcriptional regulator [Candidatus Limnocylindrales bacterium]|nr:MarR family winged helix-turn-helix transcriptional regulator [Candidatus Limnocylindrales bacterium]
MGATTPIDRKISPRDPRIATWRDFLVVHALLQRTLDQELRAEHDVSLAEYDALLVLAGAPNRRLRMHQLADQVLLSRSGVTRLIDRLVADGSVERENCSTDARGAEAVLTPAGLNRLREASGTHLRGIAEHFLDVVSDDQLEALGGVMSTILAGLDRPGTLENGRSG